jgi:hypothetical protein
VGQSEHLCLLATGGIRLLGWISVSDIGTLVAALIALLAWWCPQVPTTEEIDKLRRGGGGHIMVWGRRQLLAVAHAA